MRVAIPPYLSISASARPSHVDSVANVAMWSSVICGCPLEAGLVPDERIVGRAPVEAHAHPRQLALLVAFPRRCHQRSSSPARSTRCPTLTAPTSPLPQPHSAPRAGPDSPVRRAGAHAPRPPLLRPSAASTDSPPPHRLSGPLRRSVPRSTVD